MSEILCFSRSQNNFLEENMSKAFYHAIFLLITFFILCQAANVIIDGDFENQTVGNHTETTPWYTENGTYYTVSNLTNQAATASTNILSVMSTPNISICQTISGLEQGVKYTYGFRLYYMRNSNQFPPPLELNVILDGQESTVSNYANLAPNTFVDYFYYLTIAAPSPTYIIGFVLRLYQSNVNTGEQIGIDDVFMEMEPRIMISATWEILLSSTDSRKAQIKTDFVQNYGWNLTQFASYTSLIVNGTVLNATFTVISTQPLILNVSSTTPITLNPFLQLKLPDNQFKDTLGQWVYYNLQRNVTVPFSCWMRQHETIDTVEISTDLAYDRQIVADFSSGLLRMSMNSRHVPAERIDYQECGGKLCMLVLVDQYYLSDKLLRLDIPDAAVHDSLGNGCFFQITIYDLTPQLVYFSPTEKLFAEALITSVLAIVRVSSIGLNAWSLLGFNYLINSLVGFFHLAILSVLAPLSSLIWPFRFVLNQLFETMRGDGFVSLFLSDVAHLYNNTDFLKFLPERLDKQREGYCWIGKFNFMENFLANIWDDLLGLVYFLFKLSLVKLISLFPISSLRLVCNKIWSMKVRLLMFELIAVNPTLLIVLGDMVGKHSKSSFLGDGQKWNLMLVILVPFFFIIPIFALTWAELSHKSVAMKIKSIDPPEKMAPQISSILSIQNHKELVNIKNCLQNKNKQIRQSKMGMQKNQCPTGLVSSLVGLRISYKWQFRVSQLPEFLYFLDNFMFFLIPFTAVTFNVTFFLIVQTTIVTFRLIVLLKIKSAFTNYKFVKEMINKMIWFLYNGCFIALAATDDSILCIKFFGCGVLAFLLLGITSECIFSLIDFSITIYQFLKDNICCKQSKIQPQLEGGQQASNEKCERKQRKRFLGLRYNAKVRHSSTDTIDDLNGTIVGVAIGGKKNHQKKKIQNIEIQSNRAKQREAEQEDRNIFQMPIKS